jgi:hypothetical protein
MLLSPRFSSKIRPPLLVPRATVAKAKSTERKRYRRERKKMSEEKSEAVVSSVFVETYQNDCLPQESVFILLSPFSSVSAVLSPSLFPLFGIPFLSLETTMNSNSNSNSPSSPADALGASLPTANAVGRQKKRLLVPQPKYGEACWGQLEGNLGCRTIQHKAQNSTGVKSRGTKAGVKQHGFGDPCRGDMVN